MRLQNPFAAIAPTGLDSQVLTVLTRTEEYLTVSRIHALIPESGSLEGIRRSISRLVTQGTVLERMTGRTSAYSLNRNHLLAESILAIAGAKQNLIERFAGEIATWVEQPLTVKLFGSAARNDMVDSSDIDIVIVMPSASDREAAIELVDGIAALGHLLTGNDVRPLLYFSNEVQPADIFDSVLADGIDIAGDPTWLRRHLRKESKRHVA